MRESARAAERQQQTLACCLPPPLPQEENADLQRAMLLASLNICEGDSCPESEL